MPLHQRGASLSKQHANHKQGSAGFAYQSVGCVRVSIFVFVPLLMLLLHRNRPHNTISDLQYVSIEIFMKKLNQYTANPETFQYSELGKGTFCYLCA